MRHAACTFVACSHHMQQSILSSFGASAKIDVHLANPSGRAHLTIPAADGSGPQTTYIYSSREDISGEVKVTVMGGKKIEHSGVRVELKGVVGECNNTAELTNNNTPNRTGWPHVGATLIRRQPTLPLSLYRTIQRQGPS